MTIFADAIHIEKHTLPNGKVLVCVIEYDPSATNPREGVNLGKILIEFSKSRWVTSPDDVVNTDIALGSNPYEHWDNIRREQLQVKKSDIAIAFPIIKHEHGDMSLTLGYRQGWDFDVVGFVYATKQQVRDWYGVRRLSKSIIERAENCIQAEIDTLADWLNGKCYSYRSYEVEYNDLGDIEDYTEVDSCWGFVGGMHYCRRGLQAASERALMYSDEVGIENPEESNKRSNHGS